MCTKRGHTATWHLSCACIIQHLFSFNLFGMCNAPSLCLRVFIGYIIDRLVLLNVNNTCRVSYRISVINVFHLIPNWLLFVMMTHNIISRVITVKLHSHCARRHAAPHWWKIYDKYCLASLAANILRIDRHQGKQLWHNCVRTPTGDCLLALLKNDKQGRDASLSHN